VNSFARVALGCLGLPVVLIAAFAGRVAFDRWMYDLPGKVLESPEKPSRTLATPFQVAEALDAYVQPRFEILRDRSFGAFRIVYRKHAGLVQLKVDTPEEKALIADVNAAGRDYAIYLLHCAATPGPYHRPYKYTEQPRLELLYFNREAIVDARDYLDRQEEKRVANANRLDQEGVAKKAVAALPKLRRGEEVRVSHGDWDVLMRPTRATKPACVSCHTDAQVGTTLGVMVYAVRKTKADAPTVVSQR
jgi:hypothetical protein